MTMTDSELIGQAQARYAQAVDDRDVEGQVDLFTDDGSYISAVTGKHAGRPAVRKAIEEIFANQPVDRRTEHLFGKSVITIEGDRAQMTTDVVVYERFGEGPWQLFCINRHTDQLVRWGDTWLFQEKRVQRR
jgi:uncharacterized protein (TIGR02246 family)